MSELPDAIYAQVERYSERGNRHADRGEHAFAIREWEQALALLPEPQEQWDAAMWLWASIGDAHWQSGNPTPAREALRNALNSPAALDNPFVYFRLGQAERRLGNPDAAADALMRAYMLAGEEIFEDDPDGEAELAFLKTRARI